ncbi:MAG: 4-hydroxythreonine-4-phosphate dehydrogenase PdxA [Micrococcales bacterium]|nr:4-hydroxythreonine-4-phosphate dehydrogenase PdxA [Micrococcales bacterium]
MNPPVLALSIGDPAGIGPEIALRTLAEFSDGSLAHGIAVGDLAVMDRARAAAGLAVELRAVDRWDGQAAPGVVDVFDIEVVGDDPPPWGQVSQRAGQAAVTAIETATRAALDGLVDGVVTGPINKEAIWLAGSEHLGHTEMLGALTGATEQDTMFVVRRTHAPFHQLRIFFATRHLSLRRAVDAITLEAQLASLRRAVKALGVFGFDEARLAVAALNPHGGEGGAFGDEEIKSIGPAVAAAQQEGLNVEGPIPADSVFHLGLMGEYDAVLAQYHDQGHIASKTFDFDGTISVTVGLPILRTSVDHGTAFDIAGRGMAGHQTMRSAFLAAAELADFAPALRQAYGRDLEAAG